MTEMERAFEDRFGLASENPALGSLPAGLSQVLSRRTHRHYEEKKVDLNDLYALIAIALAASSKSDFQQASVIIVDNADHRAAIGAKFPAMPWIGSSPAFLLFCGDTLRLEEIGDMRGHKVKNRAIEGFLNAAVDAALVMQTLILAAERMGLGCCPISVIRNQASAVAQILGLPAGVFPVAGLCIGYPAREGHISMRLPMSVTVHKDRYDNSKAAAEVRAYDVRREARHPTPASAQRDVAQFGTAGEYGWSEDKARQAADPEGEPFARYLLESGFKF
ncbi:MULTISPECIES: nitroreductase family protein [Hyphomicrobiales]|jgi:nitroreductase|uniref:nitroreductase family protein n=1 Tax=Methylobacterium sp. CCH7-A2 TaxID=1768789 RepID=UPI0008340374|nr:MULTISPECIES: nitroreductase family protein [Hyphomicrobiales]